MEEEKELTEADAEEVITEPATEVGEVHHHPAVGPWKLLSVALGVLVVILLAQQFMEGGAGTVSSTQAAEEVEQLLEDTYSPLGATSEVTSVTEEHGMYLVEFNIMQDGTTETHTLHITKDGQLVVIQAASPDEIRMQFQMIQEMQAQGEMGELEETETETETE